MIIGNLIALEENTKYNFCAWKGNMGLCISSSLLSWVMKDCKFVSSSGQHYPTKQNRPNTDKAPVIVYSVCKLHKLCLAQIHFHYQNFLLLLVCLSIKFPIHMMLYSKLQFSEIQALSSCHNPTLFRTNMKLSKLWHVSQLGVPHQQWPVLMIIQSEFSYHLNCLGLWSLLVFVLFT